jgi:hypothetical protein
MINPAQRLMMQKKPIIPPNLKPNVLAWWDARERGQVWYGLNQVVANGNFANGTTGWTASNAGIPTAANNILSFTATAANGFVYQTLNPATIVGHKYYARARVKSSSNAVGIRIGTNTASNHSGSNLYETLSTIYTATNITHSVNIIDARASNWTAVEVQSVMAYDLTLAMGLGNEPTATEMDAILTADGTAYWEGTKQVLCNPDNK